jgi:AcrR family transcriptional regulator
MPKIVDHERYRKELLSQCFDLFADKGYGALTMRQIAQALGVSTGTLYHYFPSKEALFEQLIEELTEQDIHTITSALEGTVTLSDRIAAAFAFLEQSDDYFVKQTLILMDFYQQQGEAAIRQSGFFKRMLDRARQAVSKLLEVRDPDLEIFILGLVDGLTLQKIFDCDSVSLKKQSQILTEMLTLYLNSKLSSSELPSESSDR